jgi:hypothetical protein
MLGILTNYGSNCNNGGKHNTSYVWINLPKPHRLFTGGKTYEQAWSVSLRHSFASHTSNTRKETRTEYSFAQLLWQQNIRK